MDRISPQETEKKVDLDQQFQALANSWRRRILLALVTDAPRWKDEFEIEAFRPAGTPRTAAAIDLHHNHLPHLDDAELIDWDRTTGLIKRGEHFEEIRPLLDRINDLTDQSPSTDQ